MSDAQPTERQLAVDLFNEVWTLMGRSDRGAQEDAAMVHAAHASVHHWSNVGTGENLARGEWQVSRVYTVLGRAEPARWHAERCLALCQEHGLVDWDLAYAHEALARAALVAGEADEARRQVAEARDVPVAEDDDRELLEKDLATIEASLRS
jgi:hypothetical protein